MPACVELFAGGGGAALGLRAAGFAGPHFEWDADAVSTLEAAGFDAHQVDVSQLDATGWAPPFLLWASPPCQAFSTAGKRLGALDERNGWPWTLRIVDECSPTWLVCENVPGLTQHDAEHCGDPDRCPGCYWLRVILPSYRARFPWVGVWKLNAADFGVPQTRHRVFLVAGPHAVRPPQPTHAERGKTRGLFGELKPWVSIGEALGLTGHAVETARTRATGVEYEESSIDEPSTTVTAVQIGNAGPFVVGPPSHTIRNGNGSGPMLRPAPTVTGSEVKGSGKGANAHKMQRASDALYLGTGRRRLTVEECAILQGFPDGHPFKGTKASQYKQVGNAVPPIVAQRIAEAIRRAANV